MLTVFVFIDRDLYKLMEENFPEDTEENIIQVVLAMINAVQLLYNDDSLDVDIQFLIKRLEILQTDPPKLERSYNIDRYLASFCKVSVISQGPVPVIACYSPLIQRHIM